MRLYSAFAGMLFFCCAALGDDARWIWYPGDYGIWWGNALQARRLQRGAHLPPFWPQYEPHSRVLFHKEVKLSADEPLEVRFDGNGTVCWWDDKGAFMEGSVILGRFLLPKNATMIEIKIQNGLRPPSVWIKGPNVVSDSTWTVGWGESGDRSQDLPCDSSSRFTDPSVPPALAKFPVERKKPVRVMTAEVGSGSLAAADFGRESYGYLRFLNIRGKGAVKVIYAESEAEMKAVDLVHTNGDALDGWEMIELSEAEEHRLSVPRGFRYINVLPGEGKVSIGALDMDHETKAMPVRGSFRCSDPELNRIWDVAVHTLDLTCREVFIEGIKRDHWVWSGDAVQSFLMNYYVFGDYDGCRDTLWTLRGKDPVRSHLNRIMDYTFYWFDAVEKYRLYSGDQLFARQVYPRLKSLMEFVISRLDENGRPVNVGTDWIFIDWAPQILPNYGGVTSFEQMLLSRALESSAAIAREVGAESDAAAYEERAKKLRGEIISRYWNAEKGALMHMIYNDGRMDPMVTRYPNMFGLFFGYFDKSQRESVVRNVIFNDEVMKIQTPYMRFYELESLCALGMQEKVTGEIKSYWGDMLRLGATSFWELYNPTEKGDAHYAMYGRRFGKSLCHAWGASPVYLFGKYYLGVVPVKPGFAEYEVRPCRGGLEWIEGDVPTPFGKVHVRADASAFTVRSDGGKGTLITPDGRRVPVPAGKTVVVAVKAD